MSARASTARRAPARAPCSRPCRAPCRVGRRAPRIRASDPRRASAATRGEAEVEDLDAAVGGEEDVLRLQVAMDDALLVRRGEAARDLDGDLDRLADGQRAALQRSRSVSPSSSSDTT